MKQSFIHRRKLRRKGWRKQAKRQQWGSGRVAIPAEGYSSTSAKILRTKETWHIPELIEGHKKQEQGQGGAR